MNLIKIGVGGPVGAGKTQLVERLTRHLSAEISMAAITNDIYTIEDAKILAANGILPLDRIIGIETGGCPHTAIREDTSMNSAAVEELRLRHPGLEVVFIESGETTFRPRSARSSWTSRSTSSTSRRAKKSRARPARA
ncbi:urease accessory protein UreG [Arthrobacter sp. Hiyo4]|nr:urease accessory protein UreG [Arthrobacter sp. Hiyo4]